MKMRHLIVAVLCTVIAAPAHGQESLTARTMTVANGVQVSWTQLQPQPFNYLVYRMPSGPRFPKRVDPDYNALMRRWVDTTAKRGVTYRYRVCAAYAADGTPVLCSGWLR